ITPVQCSAECSLPRRRGPPTLPNKIELLVEKGSRSIYSISINLAGGEFDCQCNSVEPTTNLANDRGIGLVQFKRETACGRAFDEKPSRGKGEYLRSCEPSLVGRAFQGRQRLNMLAFNT